MTFGTTCVIKTYGNLSTVPTDTWVNFKLFGLFGLTMVFTLAIGFYLARHMKEAPDG